MRLALYLIQVLAHGQLRVLFPYDVFLFFSLSLFFFPPVYIFWPTAPSLRLVGQMIWLYRSSENYDFPQLYGFQNSSRIRLSLGPNASCLLTTGFLVVLIFAYLDSAFLEVQGVFQLLFPW